jgi:hypothetical protein
MVGRCFRSFPFQEFAAPDLMATAGREAKPPCFVDLYQPASRIRLATKHPPCVSGLAQIVAGLPENAVAPASPSARRLLPHLRHRT